jgi:histidinol-phosphatase
MNPDWRTRYELAVEAATRAGDFARSHFDAGIRVEWKADNSPVTAADRGAEELLRKEITARFPDDGFLGEEYGDTPGTSGFRWVIDPIDGTRSFVRNIPIWATLVGLEYRGEQIAGVCYAPALGQTWRALKGDGAYRDGRPIRVSETPTLSEALLVYSSIGWFQRASREASFLELCRRTHRQRGYGDFYGFVLVAQGSCDAMIEHGVHAWDVAATKVIIEEAGGRFTDWGGVPTIDRPDVVASNGKLHEPVLEILRG